MHRTLFVAASTFALVACGMQGQDNPEQGEASSIATAIPSGGPDYETYSDDNHADSMASNDGAIAATDNSDKQIKDCLLYTSPSPRDYAASRMPSSA